MNKKVCYIPTVNCEQLGVYINHENAQIKAIKALVEIFNIEMTKSGYSRLNLSALIGDIIENDGANNDYVWIEEIDLYE